MYVESGNLSRVIFVMKETGNVRINETLRQVRGKVVVVEKQ
jgi:hypothetical protein